jgi:hypothetical protein
VKRPSFQFYPSDWLRDAKLRLVSVSARGLWIDLLCWMHDLQPYGHLALNGEAIPDEKAAVMCGVPLPVYRRLVAELLAADVAARSPTGALYSRRMDRDAQTRIARGIAGHMGQQARQQLTQQFAEDEKEEEESHTSSTPDGFDAAWAIYPKRPNNSKERARKAWEARIREGCDPNAILEGLRRYAGYCRRQRTDPQYIKQASTFFGPDHHWENDYTVTVPREAHPHKPAYHDRYVPPKREDVDPKVIELTANIGNGPKVA